MAKTIAEAFENAAAGIRRKELLEEAAFYYVDAQLRPWMIYPYRFDEVDRHLLRDAPKRVAAANGGASYYWVAEEAVGEALLRLCSRDPDLVPWATTSISTLIFKNAEWAAKGILQRNAWRRLTSIQRMEEGTKEEGEALEAARPLEGVGIAFQRPTGKHRKAQVAKAQVNPRKGVATKDSIADAFKRFFDEYGRPPRAAYADKQMAPYLPSASSIYRLFNSWPEACAYAGFNGVGVAAQRKEEWDPLDVALALRAFAREEGYWPTSYDLQEHGRSGEARSMPTYGVVQRLVGGKLFPPPQEIARWVEATIRDAADRKAEPPEPPQPFVPSSTKTVLEAYEEWVASDHFGSLSKHSRSQYKREFAQHILPSWGDRWVGGITSWEIRKLLVRLRDTKPYSRMLMTRAALSNFFTFAVDQKLVAADPVKPVPKPKKPIPPDPEPQPEGDKQMVTPEQVLKALNTKMSGEQLAERMGESTREVIPIAAALHRDGLIGRVLVNAGGLVHFVPLPAAGVVQLPATPPPLAAVA